MSGRPHRPRDPAGDLETPAAGSWRRGAAIARSLGNDHDEWRGRGQLRDTRLRRYADPHFVIASSRMREASEVIDDLRNCPPRIDACSASKWRWGLQRRRSRSSQVATRARGVHEKRHPILSPPRYAHADFRDRRSARNGRGCPADEASDIRVEQDLAAKVCSPCFCDSAPLVSFGPQAHSWAPLPERPRRLSLGRLLSQGMAPSPSPVRRAIATGATIER